MRLGWCSFEGRLRIAASGVGPVIEAVCAPEISADDHLSLSFVARCVFCSNDERLKDVGFITIAVVGQSGLPNLRKVARRIFGCLINPGFVPVVFLIAVAVQRSATRPSAARLEEATTHLRVSIQQR